MCPHSPVFFVDGFMEKKILQRLEVHTHIFRTDINGKDVKISAIANKISPLIRNLKGRFRPIIILIDREDRTTSTKIIIGELYSELRRNEISDELIIGITDRTIENWILADWNNFKKNSGTKEKKIYNSFEGYNGKSIIKKYIPSYQETTDGVELFVKSKASMIQKNSKSFNDFFTQILSKRYNNYWISQ